MKQIAITLMFVCVTACSSGNDSTEASQITDTDVVTATAMPTDAPSIEDETLSLVTRLEEVLDPQVPGWDCNGENPMRDSMNMIEIYDSLSRNCVWSEVIGVVKVKFRCFAGTEYDPEQQEVCRSQLNLLATKTGIISPAEAAMIPDQSMIDGIQNSTTGVSSWKVDGGVNFVIDVEKWSASNS